MTQTTLTGSEPRVYRLEDNNIMRAKYGCVYHDLDVFVKSYNNTLPPGSFDNKGRCQMRPRYLVIYPSGEMQGRYAFCHWHVPKVLKDNNYHGNYKDTFEE